MLKRTVLGGALAAIGALAGCSNGTTVTCTPPTVLSADGKSCVDVNDGDGGTGGTTCGPNTTLMGGQCVVSASACQAAGTALEASTGTCKVPSPGTQIGTSTNFKHGYQHIFYMAPDAGTPNTDAGTGTDKPVVIGNFTAVTANGGTLPATTKLVNRLGEPIGGGMYYGVYPIDIPRPTPTVLDPNKQLTLGDWQACSGSVGWYKPAAKVNGKAVYRQVVDVANCVPDTLYTVWMFWTPDATRVNATIAAPSGGVPNSFVTDDNGNAHWERLLDADVWFKSNTALPYAGAHVAPPTIPNITTNANASVITVLIYHINQQTNGNPGWIPAYPGCAVDTSVVTPDGGTPTCLNPQPKSYINLGRTGVDSAHQLLDEPGIPLSMIQPY